MSQINELKDRVEAKRLRLQARIKELKADTRATAREESSKLEAQLDALADSIKGGWDSVTEAVAGKLNDWLKDD